MAARGDITPPWKAVNLLILLLPVMYRLELLVVVRGLPVACGLNLFNTIPDYGCL
jgi:hypothetical protein